MQRFFTFLSTQAALRLVVFIVAGAWFVHLALPVMAATLELYSVGNLITTGKTFSTLTHIGENPVFVGKAGPNAQVSIVLNSATNKVAADAAGDWSFLPTSLIVGTHSVTINANGETKAFSLVIAAASGSATVSATPTPTKVATSGGTATASTPKELPVTGGASTTMLLIVGGIFLSGIGLMSWATARAATNTVEHND